MHENKILSPSRSTFFSLLNKLQFPSFCPFYSNINDHPDKYTCANKYTTAYSHHNASICYKVGKTSRWYLGILR